MQLCPTSSFSNASLSQFCSNLNLNSRCKFKAFFLLPGGTKVRGHKTSFHVFMSIDTKVLERYLQNFATCGHVFFVDVE